MTKPKQAKWKAALFGKCPACGKGKLFKSLLTFQPACSNCQENFTEFETADGPAFFAITIIGTIVGIAAGIFEVIHEPQIWVHFALWLPITFIGSFTIMRITKALMAAHQYQLGHQGMRQ